MIRSYIVIALRNLWKNKVFSAINIAGLALGLTCSMLILMWVRDEQKIDGFHKNGSRLYTVYERQYFDGKVSGQYSSQGVLARQLKREIPEVEMATTYSGAYPHTLSAGEKIIKESGGAADSDFFRMFTYPLILGTPAEALGGPDGMAISRTMAVNFFGNPESAIGKTLRYDNRRDFKVTAVFEDLPAQVSDKFDFLLNWDFWLKDNDYLTYWDNNDPINYVMLRADARPELVEKKIVHFVDRFMSARDAGFRIELGLQPFPETYLHSHFTNGVTDGGRIEYVHLFSLVALFILLIACINFMNLTTARSIKRAKEIGVRKVIGAGRGSLIRQFFGEAVLIATISAALALILVAFALPGFNELTGKQVALPFARWSFWVTLISLAVITGLISGSYPSLFLSAFRPIVILKGGSVKAGPAALWFRKGLVIFQFVLSIVLIISTILISRQVRYVENVNLGYDRENLMYVPIEGDLAKKTDVFKEEALRLPGIASVSISSQAPTQVDNSTIGVFWPGKDPNAKPMFTQLSVGYDFMKTMKVPMVKGRDFSREFGSDTAAYILNQEAVDKIGYKEPLGKDLTFWGGPGKIVGVMGSFHFQSLHDFVKPLIIRLQTGNEMYGVLLVRTLPGAENTRRALTGVEKLCKELNPKFPFTYQFSSDEYTKLYKSEEIAGRLSMIFAFLAIFISCLGLLGLSMFTAEQRTREIGIRKVLGAGVTNLFNLLCRDFLMLVGIAFALAAPMAWWSMHQWLQHFAYHTDISLWIFAMSGVLAALIAMGTVGYQAIRAATARPVKSLRTE